MTLSFRDPTKTTRTRGCGVDGHRVGYWANYDMFGCATCDVWTESKCNWPDCDCGEYFTRPVPSKPSETGEEPETF